MEILAVKGPDLTKEYPRSPYELLGGFVLLPRIIDKCRAELCGTNGEYNFACGLDMQFFSHFGLSPEEFKEYVATGPSDDAVLAWVESKIASERRTNEALCEWGYDIRTYAPTTPEKKAYFEHYRRESVPHRQDIVTWVALLDAEEGR